MSEASAELRLNEAAVKRTDADLATASSAGDPAAFGELVLRHQDRAFNLALRLTGSPEDAWAGALVPPPAAGVQQRPQSLLGRPVTTPSTPRRA